MVIAISTAPVQRIDFHMMYGRPLPATADLLFAGINILHESWSLISGADSPLPPGEGARSGVRAGFDVIHSCPHPTLSRRERAVRTLNTSPFSLRVIGG